MKKVISLLICMTILLVGCGKTPEPVVTTPTEFNLSVNTEKDAEDIHIVTDNNADSEEVEEEVDDSVETNDLLAGNYEVLKYGSPISFTFSSVPKITTEVVDNVEHTNILLETSQGDIELKTITNIKGYSDNATEYWAKAFKKDMLAYANLSALEEAKAEKVEIGIPTDATYIVLYNVATDETADIKTIGAIVSTPNIDAELQKNITNLFNDTETEVSIKNISTKFITLLYSQLTAEETSTCLQNAGLKYNMPTQFTKVPDWTQADIEDLPNDLEYRNTGAMLTFDSTQFIVDTIPETKTLCKMDSVEKSIVITYGEYFTDDDFEKVKKTVQLDLTDEEFDLVFQNVTAYFDSVYSEKVDDVTLSDALNKVGTLLQYLASPSEVYIEKTVEQLDSDIEVSADSEEVDGTDEVVAEQVDWDDSYTLMDTNKDNIVTNKEYAIYGIEHLFEVKENENENE